MKEHNPFASRFKRFAASALEDIIGVLILVAIILACFAMVAAGMGAAILAFKGLAYVSADLGGRWFISALLGVLLTWIAVKASESTYHWAKKHWEWSKEGEEDDNE